MDRLWRQRWGRRVRTCGSLCCISEGCSSRPSLRPVLPLWRLTSTATPRTRHVDSSRRLAVQPSAPGPHKHRPQARLEPRLQTVWRRQPHAARSPSPERASAPQISRMRGVLVMHEAHRPSPFIALRDSPHRSDGLATCSSTPSARGEGRGRRERCSPTQHPALLAAAHMSCSTPRSRCGAREARRKLVEVCMHGPRLTAQRAGMLSALATHTADDHGRDGRRRAYHYSRRDALAVMVWLRRDADGRARGESCRKCCLGRSDTCSQTMTHPGVRTLPP